MLVQKNPYGLDRRRGGARARTSTQLPDAFVGVLNTKNLYWLALGYAARRLRRSCAGRSNSSPGHVWQAIRENELRVEVLGLQPVPLQADRRSCSPRSSRPPAASSSCSLLGGATPAGDDRELHADAARDGRARRHRDALRRDDRRLPLHARSTSGSARSRRSTRRRTCRPCCAMPLSEPLFILGTLFILVVFFVPGGLASLGQRRRARRSARVREPLPEEAAP